MPDRQVLELKVHRVTTIRATLETSKDSGKQTEPRVGILEYADKLEKALRILGYCVRYTNAIRAKHKPPARKRRTDRAPIAPPTALEKAHAMRYFVKKSQEKYYNSELAALTNGKHLPVGSKLEPL